MKNTVFILFIVIQLAACNQDIVVVKPKACFNYTNSNGYNVTFSNCSNNATSYLWDFGDGRKSNYYSPTHIYTDLGTYNVKLTVTNKEQSDSITKTITTVDTVSINSVFTAHGDFSLNVDRDSVMDINIFLFSHSGNSGNYAYSQISCYNGYEIITDSIDVITHISGHYPDFIDTQRVSKAYIPKIYTIGDKITNTNKTHPEKLTICDYSVSYFVSSYYNNVWCKDEIRYIGFRKTVNGKTKIGWLKLKVMVVDNYYFVITLYSYKIPTETESLLIDK